jgi:hypothetical protein
MADDDTLKALREQLEKQRADEERRHQVLLAKLAERDDRPMSQAQASATMRNGYAQSEAEREAAKAGDDGEGGDGQ